MSRSQRLGPHFHEGRAMELEQSNKILEVGRSSNLECIRQQAELIKRLTEENRWLRGLLEKALPSSESEVVRPIATMPEIAEPEPLPERPEIPQLLGRLSDSLCTNGELGWFTAYRGNWIASETINDANNYTLFAPGTIVEINRDLSDPEAVALYDAERKQT